MQNNYVKIAVAIGLIAAILLGSYIGLTLALGNQAPVSVVTTGSMCIAQDGCDGWSCNFMSTLHVGDLIFIQTLNPQEYNADYPHSDIIVFQKPDSQINPNFDTIVSRIVTEFRDSDGVYRFQTKSDGMGTQWPAKPSESEYDSHTFWTTGEGVSQDLVNGRVVMRIPYVGIVAVFVQNNLWVLPAIILLAMLVVVLKISFSKIKLQGKKLSEKQKTDQKLP